MTGDTLTDILHIEVLILLVVKQVVDICVRYQVFRSVGVSLIDLMDILDGYKAIGDITNILFEQ